MVKKLEFIEQYIDEEPKENYYRGITAMCDGIRVFELRLNINNNQFLMGGKNYFFIDDDIFGGLFKNFEQVKVKHIYKKDGSKILFTDKEKAKEYAQKAFGEYISLFVEN